MAVGNVNSSTLQNQILQQTAAQSAGAGRQQELPAMQEEQGRQASRTPPMRQTDTRAQQTESLAGRRRQEPPPAETPAPSGQAAARPEPQPATTEAAAAQPEQPEQARPPAAAPPAENPAPARPSEPTETQQQDTAETAVQEGQEERAVNQVLASQVARTYTDTTLQGRINQNQLDETA